MRRVMMVLGVLAIAYFVREVARQWSAIRDMTATLRPDWGVLALSGLVVLVSYAVLIETWRRTVVAWGERISWPAAARIWFVSNLGKYLPGKVWQIGAMGVMAQEAGVSGVAAVGSSLVVNLVNLLAGAVVVMITGAQELAGQGFIPLTVLATVLAATTPWLLPMATRVASRVTGREIDPPKVPPTAILIALVGCILAWCLYGLAFRLLAIALFGAASGTDAAYIATFTLSYLIGYVVLFAPGGLGAREAALAALLPAAHLETAAAASILILVSRLWLTVLEAVPGLVLIAVRRPRPAQSISHDS